MPGPLLGKERALRKAQICSLTETGGEETVREKALQCLAQSRACRVKQEQQTPTEPHPGGTEGFRSDLRTKLKIYILWKKTARDSEKHAWK